MRCAPTLRRLRRDPFVNATTPIGCGIRAGARSHVARLGSPGASPVFDLRQPELLLHPPAMSVKPIQRAGRRLALLAVLFGAGGCASDDEPTALRLLLEFEPAWQLDALEVVLGGAIREVSAHEQVLVLVSEDQADGERELVVWGRRDDERIARGAATVQLVRGATVDVPVSLGRLPCGAWCEAGAQRCDGNAVVTCAEEDAGCMAWADPEPCPGDMTCSVGACAETCVDECARGEERCAGPSSSWRCGQYDEDPCLDWSAAVDCAGGEACGAGRCRPATPCVGSCVLGAERCVGATIVRCGDLDFDGCLEWGRLSPCGDGESCSGDVCVPADACSDDCATDACDLDAFRVCGSYDRDACSDWSFGTACVPLDRCEVGICSASDGCANEPRACREPPQPVCLDSNTRRVFELLGECTDGECEYEHRDLDCPGCPNCDACASVDCATAPNVCLVAPGGCLEGACDFDPVDGGSCDDDDACTVDDTCRDGRCRGTKKPCLRPPGPECLDEGTLRVYLGPGECSGGECSYAHRDVRCYLGQGCRDGACRTCDARFWTDRPVDYDVLREEFPGNTQIARDPGDGLHIAHFVYAPPPPLTALQVQSRQSDDRWERSSFIIDPPPETFGDLMGFAIDRDFGRHYLFDSGIVEHLYEPLEGSPERTTVATFPDAATQGNHLQLRVDDAGGVHALYADCNPGSCVDAYAYRAPGATEWGRDLIADGQATDSQLAVDAAGGLHFAYTDLDSGALTYLYRRAGGLPQTETIDGRDIRFNRRDYPDGRPPFALAAGGESVHVLYRDPAGGLRYATRGAGWPDKLIDSGADVLEVVAELDRHGGLHVAYYDHRERRLRYAYLAPGGDDFRLSTIAQDDCEGCFPAGYGGISLAVDRAGVVHVSSLSGTDGTLRHAFGTCEL